jgi:hypothetical protein
LFNTERVNEKGDVEVAICPLCCLRVEFIGAPMVRCYSTGETYEQDEIRWTLKSKVPKEIGFDVENRDLESIGDLTAQAESSGC